MSIIKTWIKTNTTCYIPTWTTTCTFDLNNIITF